MNNQYLLYGFNWLQLLTMLDNVAHDFTKKHVPKPGNALLPSWGFCEVYVSLRDNLSTHING